MLDVHNTCPVIGVEGRAFPTSEVAGVGGAQKIRGFPGCTYLGNVKCAVYKHCYQLLS